MPEPEKVQCSEDAPFIPILCNVYVCILFSPQKYCDILVLHHLCQAIGAWSKVCHESPRHTWTLSPAAVGIAQDTVSCSFHDVLLHLPLRLKGHLEFSNKILSSSPSVSTTWKWLGGHPSGLTIGLHCRCLDGIEPCLTAESRITKLYIIIRYTHTHTHTSYIYSICLLSAVIWPHH